MVSTTVERILRKKKQQYAKNRAETRFERRKGRENIDWRNWGNYPDEVIEMLKKSIARMGQPFAEVMAHKDKNWEYGGDLYRFISISSSLG